MRRIRRIKNDMKTRRIEGLKNDSDDFDILRTHHDDDEEDDVIHRGASLKRNMLAPSVSADGKIITSHLWLDNEPTETAPFVKQKIRFLIWGKKPEKKDYFVLFYVLLKVCSFVTAYLESPKTNTKPCWSNLCY